MTLYAVPDPNDFVFDSSPIAIGNYMIGTGRRQGSPNAAPTFAICSPDHGIVELGMDAATEAIARLVSKERVA